MQDRGMSIIKDGAKARIVTYRERMQPRSGLVQHQMYFGQNWQGVKEGGAINGEVGEALSSNRGGKEKTLKGRFRVSMKIRA
jgi:hypothetical protein